MYAPYLKTFLFLCVVGVTSILLFPIIGYRAVGFIFLLAVLAIGSVATLGPVLFSALLSALAWNFLFIPPRFTFAIAQLDDIILCVAYFVAAIITGLLTNKIRIREIRLRQAERLKESEKLHQTLLNSISHELRTPLTTIIGSATALSDEHAPDTKEYRHAIATELLLATDRLNRVIENLLDMSRLNSGAMSLKREWHDVHDLVGVTLQRLGKNLDGFTIKTDIASNLPLIEIDFRMMEHVLSNLLINSAQYSPKGTEIKITAVPKYGKAVIVIEDQGPGIDPSQLTKIFEKFYRVPGTPTGGTGLGLSIAKSIIELHQGTIEAEHNKHGKFNILLPLGRPPEVPKEKDATNIGR
jgi:two-component system sensor histidine kinase KdpD